METYDLESASVLQHRQNTHRRRTCTFILKRRKHTTDWDSLKQTHTDLVSYWSTIDKDLGFLTGWHSRNFHCVCVCVPKVCLLSLCFPVFLNSVDFLLSAPITLLHLSPARWLSLQAHMSLELPQNCTSHIDLMVAAEIKPRSDRHFHVSQFSSKQQKSLWKVLVAMILVRSWQHFLTGHKSTLLWILYLQIKRY